MAYQGGNCSVSRITLDVFLPKGVPASHLDATENSDFDVSDHPGACDQLLSAL